MRCRGPSASGRRIPRSPDGPAHLEILKARGRCCPWHGGSSPSRPAEPPSARSAASSTPSPC
jgi:hypothetical protein